MCVIVDADVAVKFFRAYLSGRMKLRGQPVPLALGKGKHKKQLLDIHTKLKIEKLLIERRRGEKGSTLLTTYETANEIAKLKCAEKKLPLNQKYKSKKGDRHILALARVSGSRLLVTGDKNLKKDFRSKKIVPARRWGDGKNDGGKIFPLERGEDKERQRLFNTMPPCI